MASKTTPRSIRRLVDGKVLTGEHLVDDSWAIVSTRVFAVIDSKGGVIVQRPWHEVATGEWDAEKHIMTVTWVDGSRPTRIKTTNDAPVAFPRLFKERVDASVVYADSQPIMGGVLRGALRRTPQGDLISQISSDKELPVTPELEKQVAAFEQRLWEFVGI